MFRAIVMVLYLLCVGIMSIVLIPIAHLIGVSDKTKQLHFSFALVKWYLTVYKSLSGADITYIGLENLPPKDEAVVYIGNHRGTFDIMFLYAVFKGPTGFVAKKEMQTWPIISWWMGFIHCLFMDRKNQMEGVKTILKGIQYVKEGTSMVIFPEGTRSKIEGVLLDFHAGSFKLATKPKVKLIPVAINNTSQVFEDHVPFVRKAKVAVEFCEPIDTAALSAEELKALPETVHALIQEKVIANGIKIGSLPADFDPSGQ